MASSQYDFYPRAGDHSVGVVTAVRLSEEETRENPLVSVASGEKWTVST